MKVSFVIPYWNLSRLYFLLASISSWKSSAFSIETPREFLQNSAVIWFYQHHILIELNKHTDLETSFSCIFYLSKSNWMFIVRGWERNRENAIIYFYFPCKLSSYVGIRIFFKIELTCTKLIWDNAYPDVLPKSMRWPVIYITDVKTLASAGS